MILFFLYLRSLLESPSKSKRLLHLELELDRSLAVSTEFERREWGKEVRKGRRKGRLKSWWQVVYLFLSLQISGLGIWALMMWVKYQAVTSGPGLWWCFSLRGIPKLVPKLGLLRSVINSPTTQPKAGKVATEGRYRRERQLKRGEWDSLSSLPPVSCRLLCMLTRYLSWQQHPYVGVLEASAELLLAEWTLFQGRKHNVEKDYLRKKKKM